MKKYLCIMLTLVFILNLVDFAFAAPRSRRVRPSSTASSMPSEEASSEDSSAAADEEGKTKIRGKLGKAAIEADKKAKAEAAAKAKKEAEERARQEAKDKAAADAKAKKEAEERAKLEAEMKAKAEAEARIKLEAELKAKAEADAKAKAEAEARAKAEAEAREKSEREARARADAEALAAAQAAEEAKSKRGPRSRTRLQTDEDDMTAALRKAEEKTESDDSRDARKREIEAAKLRAQKDEERARAAAEARAAEAATAAALMKAKEVAKEGKRSSKGPFSPFIVYSDNGAKGNHYYPTGWMGDYGDLKVNPGNTEKVHSGTSAFKITYSAKGAQNAGWCGIYWQNPPNNWGDKKGGYNLSGARKLSFWACGEKGGEVISEFKIGGISGEYPDSDTASIGPIELSKKWQNYIIDLEDRDLTNIIGGFCFAASRDDNPEGFTIYIDDVIYQ